MRSSTILSLVFAGLTVASPLKVKEKKDYVADVVVYDVVTDVVWVTVITGESVTLTPPIQVSTLVSISTSIEVPVSIPTSIEVPTTVVVLPTTSSVTVVASSSSSTVSTAPAATATVADHVTASLHHHNIHRNNHSAPDVEWDDTLAKYAVEIAASCKYAHDMTVGGGGYGQNIAVYGSTNSQLEALGQAYEISSAATDMWYNGEINWFDESFYGEAQPDETNFEKYGHFTQMVWVSSTKIGCAAQYCDAGTIFGGFPSWFTVCNYGPEGNMGNEYGTNVLPPLGNPSISVE